MQLQPPPTETTEFSGSVPPQSTRQQWDFAAPRTLLIRKVIRSPSKVTTRSENMVIRSGKMNRSLRPFNVSRTITALTRRRQKPSRRQDNRRAWVRETHFLWVGSCRGAFKLFLKIGSSEEVAIVGTRKLPRVPSDGRTHPPTRRVLIHWASR